MTCLIEYSLLSVHPLMTNLRNCIFVCKAQSNKDLEKFAGVYSLKMGKLIIFDLLLRLL